MKDDQNMEKEPESNAWKKRKEMAADSLEKDNQFIKIEDAEETNLEYSHTKEKRLGPRWRHFDDIMRMMLFVFPEMELGEDLDGQLVVYTGWESASSDGFYAPMKEESE